MNLPSHIKARLDAQAACNMIPAGEQSRVRLLCLGVSIRGMSKDTERDLHAAACAYIATLPR